ncbi:MAG: hypothetical protein QOJ39_770 [Candidatus Eremiobacteraeota bacterium]|jgi:uncharacterized protein (TIGR02246 family)|nr:hypothetical protein [Candidatus Eremiobacteraeota bacterium]
MPECSAMTQTAPHDADAIAAALTEAWNAADGEAFARQFTEDADFVNIFAMHAVGRDAIAHGHQMILDGVYRGSVNEFTVTKVRGVRDDVMIAFVKAKLDVPQGPMAGALHALASAVLVREGDGWKIASFHNTREQAPPPLGAAVEPSRS